MSWGFITTAKALLSHNRNLGVEEVGGWGGAVLVAAKFFNFTVNFLGNYWCFWWTFYGTSSPPVRRCTCLAAKGRGSSSHFWHKFPPPISGPCHHWWPLWHSLNRMSLVSEASCTLSAPLGWRWVDWTMTSLCVCVCVCVCGFGGKVWEGTAVVFYVKWILKHTKLTVWSVKMCSDDISDV